MSQTKYLVSSKSQLQDPEAILSVGSVSEKDEKVLISSKLEPFEDVATNSEKESNGNNSNHNFEYPTVTINGEPTQDIKEMPESDHLSQQRSRLQSVSEPDLTQVGLYCNQKDHILTSGPHGQQEDIRRKINQKIDVRRGRKINNIQLGLDSNKLQINFVSKDNSKEKVSNKEDVTDRSNARYNRIFKKTSQDGNLVLFLPQRELMVNDEGVEPLMGVALIHESIIKKAELKVFLQIVLIFRYGRDDEELLGLRFCNEVVVAADQIHPPPDREDLKKDNKPTDNSDKADDNAFKPPGMDAETIPKIKESSVKPTNQRVHPTVLANAQGFIAIPFVVNIGSSAPPSVRLIPCRPYSGAPIGTTYEVQLFTGTNPEEIPTTRRKMVSMSLRILETLPRELPPKSDVFLEKKSLISGISGNDFALVIRAQLDSPVYTENDKIMIRLNITKRRQRSSKGIEEDEEYSSGHGNGHGVRKIKISAIQQVGIALFSSGNFKNCLGNVIIKSDASSARTSTSSPIRTTPESCSGASSKTSSNIPKANRRRYSLMPLPSIFRGATPSTGKDLEVPDEKESETVSDEKSTKNFSALKTFMTPKGRKNSDSADVTEAVYATRPIKKGGRRYSCMPTDNKTINSDNNMLPDRNRTRTISESKDEPEEEESNVLTDVILEPTDETFSSDIPLKIALEKDYSWAAMDDTSKNVAELIHLAPTVYHANKALFIVRVSYFVQVVVFYGLLKRSVTLKLPFILARPNQENFSMPSNQKETKTDDKLQAEKQTSLDVPDLKDGKKINGKNNEASTGITT